MLPACGTVCACMRRRALQGRGGDIAGTMATTSNAALRKKTPFYVSMFLGHDTRSLSDLKNRSEKIAEREQNLIIFSAIVFPIAEKISELWAAQVFLQPIPFKSDRLLDAVLAPTGQIPCVRHHFESRC